MEKKLKTVLELRNQTLKIYDSIRFCGQISYEDFKIVEQQKKLSTELLAESMLGYMPVITTEECIIEPGETKELKTNIDEFPVDSIEENKMLEFTHEGIICTYGYLSFYLVKDYEDGNKIMVTNNVPREVLENYDLCGYHYCDPTTTKYFLAGVYQIEKDKMIGIMGFDPQLIENYDETTQLNIQEKINEQALIRQKLFNKHTEDI